MKWFLLAVMMTFNPGEPDLFVFEKSFKNETECTIWAFENQQNVLHTLQQNFEGRPYLVIACIEEKMKNEIIGRPT